MERLVAVVLAAGTGSRLLPLTADRPKATIPFLNSTPLGLLTDSLRSVGVKELFVVRGANGASVKSESFRTIESASPGNMVKSLMAAHPYIPRDASVLVCYGDLILQRSVLRSMVDNVDGATAPVLVAVDKDWLSYYRWRFEGEFGDAESCVVDGEGIITSIGEALAPDEIPTHQFVGLVRFSPEGFRHALDIWNELGILQMQTTQLLQIMGSRGFTVRARVINGGWLEIDSLNDLKGALRVCSFQESVPFFDAADVT